MAILGRWNWWLPARIARLARVQASKTEGARDARAAPPRSDRYLTTVIARRIAGSW